MKWLVLYLQIAEKKNKQIQPTVDAALDNSVEIM